MTVKAAIQRLSHLCEIIPPLLSGIPEADFSRQPAPGKWSKKEILGHLIDSATNNHQRFVRVQFEEMPLIAYDQNKWNAYSYYPFLPLNELIAFWTSYNRHLAALAGQIPESSYEQLCRTGSGKPVTLGFLIEDYVNHLEHHLKQLLDYD